MDTMFDFDESFRSFQTGNGSGGFEGSVVSGSQHHVKKQHDIDSYIAKMMQETISDDDDDVNSEELSTDDQLDIYISASRQAAERFNLDLANFQRRERRSEKSLGTLDEEEEPPSLLGRIQGGRSHFRSSTNTVCTVPIENCSSFNFGSENSVVQSCSNESSPIKEKSVNMSKPVMLKNFQSIVSSQRLKIDTPKRRLMLVAGVIGVILTTLFIYLLIKFEPWKDPHTDVTSS
mmetsp:Transcript_25297/g.38366  ORF Transcript_25297/g.38366 Transcript_25297/m.38366 type:complete len:233 (-) Transcript_25297:91-789(-)